MKDPSGNDQELLREISSLKQRIKELERSGRGEPLSAAPDDDEEARRRTILFRCLFESSPDAIAVLDGEGRVLEINKSFETLFGYSQSESFGRKINELVAPGPYLDDAIEVSQAVFDNGKIIQKEAVRCRKDGQPFHVLLVGYPIIVNQGQAGVFAIYRDITEQKQAREELILKGEQFQDFIDRAPYSVQFYDLQGHCFYANKAYYKLWPNLPPPEWSVFEDQQLAKSGVGPFFERLRQGEGVVLPPIRFRPSQSVSGDVDIERCVNTVAFPLRDSKGDIQLFALIIEDITERKHAEETLRESEERLRLALEGANQGLFDMNLRTGEAVVSAVYVSMLGYEPGEVTPSADWWQKQVHPDDLETATQVLGDCMEGRCLEYRMEYRLRHKSGEWRWILSLGRVVETDGEGRPLRLLGTHTDITERRRAEEALRISELTYREIFNTVNDTIWIHNIDTGEFVDVNDTVEDMFGYPVSKALALDVGGISSGVPPFTREKAMEYFQKAAEGNPQSFEWECRHKDGHLFWTEVNLKRGTIAGKECVLAIYRDITERKRTENALRQSEERFSKAFQASPAPLVISEIETGRFIDVNEAWVRMLEYTREEQLGKTSKEVGIWMSPGDRDRLVDKLKNKGYFREEPIDFRTQSGRHVRAFWSAETVVLDNRKVMLSMLYDETERKQAEEDLRRLSFAIEQSAEEVVITDPEGVIQYVNPAFEKITGYSRQEAIGQTPRILKSGAHDDAFYQNLWDTIKGGNVWTGQLTNRRKDGALIHEDATISPLANSVGQLTGFVSLKRDVTEEVRLHTELRQAQKMEAVGTLAGGVAHDFNNILSVIMGFGTLLHMGMKDSDPLRKHVDQIIAASRKAADLTRSLLAFSRKQPITLTPMGMNTAVKGAEKLLNRLLTEDIELQVFLSPEDTIVMADASQIDQILFNLATNARDAMKKGGRLTVGVAPFIMDDRFRDGHGFGKPGNYALLTVSDTGCGMDEPTREKIFDPFFTTKELGRGTGLGLSTVYGIVKQHDGYIDVISKPLEGTTFYVYIPAIEAVVEEEKEHTGKVRIGDEKILVAEDDTDVRLLMKEILSGHGYTVVEAFDGQDAVDKFKAFPDVSLVVIDSVMPRKNGREAADEIRATNPRVKILFMSGYTKDIVLDKGVEEGKVEFISKPVIPGELLKKVREILDA